MRKAGISTSSPGCSHCVPILGLSDLMRKTSCFAMFGLRFNILLGVSGMRLSVMRLFSGRCYATGWLVTAHGWEPPPAIWPRHRRCGFRCVIGLIAIRRSESLSAMGTRALSQWRISSVARARHRRREWTAGYPAAASSACCPMKSERRHVYTSSSGGRTSQAYFALIGARALAVPAR